MKESYGIFEVLYVYAMNCNYIRIILFGKIYSQNNSKSEAPMLCLTESVALSFYARPISRFLDWTELH